MDILSRLKKFMEAYQITSSQFADNCGISRPTLSQILTGRNKKISDELIAKIHVGYPSLSILWLMFGEGTMESGANIKISEPQNGAQLTFDDPQFGDSEVFGSGELAFGNVQKNSSENSGDLAAAVSPQKSSSSAQNFIFANSSAQKSDNDLLKAVTESAEPSKRITSIVVFYADNTFQTFTPSY